MGVFRKGTIVMKLAEALSLRAETLRRLESLRSRITANARYQEGETPSEDAAALLTEAQSLIDEWQSLMRRINRTNAASDLGADGTLTDALARRDALRLHHRLLTGAADAAAGADHSGFTRQLRSELKILAALPVSQVRAEADRVSRDLRELDARIQRANWEVDLLD
ncbi:DIP1984 family protein [Gordonia hirsuta]